MFKQFSNSMFGSQLFIMAAVFLFLAGNIQAQGTSAVTAPATAVLQQCANGGVGLPHQQCTGANWVLTDATQANSHWSEGDSVAYRDVFANLVPGTAYTKTIAYNTTVGGKHAFDYLTSYNRTEADANACSGVPVCSGPSLFPIPIDPNVTRGADSLPGSADDITQIPGSFSIWNGTINSVSSYLLNGSYAGDSWTLVSITFTPTSSNAVLAWGGHIATRADWGANNTAISLAGSPYHTQNYGFIGTNVTDFCAQTVSVSPATSFSPASLTIIKEVNIVGGVSSQAFTFFATSASGSTSFTLTDNGTVGLDRTTLTYATNPGPITVNELPITNWSLTNVNCTIAVGTGTSVGTTGVLAGTATINLNSGNAATCTFQNTFVGPTAATGTISGRVTTKSGYGIRGAQVKVLDATTGATRLVLTNTFGYYTVANLPVEDLYVLNVSSKLYTFSDNSQQSFVMHEDAAGINFTSDQ